MEKLPILFLSLPRTRGMFLQCQLRFKRFQQIFQTEV